MKSFVAEDSFWELFPQAAVGVVIVKGMKPAAQISQEDVDAIAALLDRANIDAERHLTSDTISENAPVKAWREAYRLFKTKKGARCSIENLLKRVLKGKPVGHITPAVDIYNTVSLTYALPVGGEDLLAIECVEPERMGDCQAAIDRLAELLERYLGATVVVKTLVTRDNPCAEL